MSRSISTLVPMGRSTAVNALASGPKQFDLGPKLALGWKGSLSSQPYGTEGMVAIQAPRSGARLFEIAPQGRYLIAQGLGPLQISPGEGNCQGKLQLL